MARARVARKENFFSSSDCGLLRRREANSSDNSIALAWQWHNEGATSSLVRRWFAGLEIGGLNVPFDQSVVGMIDEMFNPKTTTLKELMNRFNMIVHNDDIEVYFDWYVSEQDCGESAICAAFRMDEEVMPEGSRHEGSMVEKEKIEKSDDEIWEATVEERMRFGFGVDVDLNEESAGAFDEEAIGGADEEAATVADEEVAGAADEELAAAFDEEAAVEEPDGCAIERIVIQIDDDVVDDEKEGNDEPLSIPHLCSYVGDPSITMDVDKLYYVVSLRDISRR
ncbi:hypothetical protein LR48_Vigan07g114300 [Vigna angularis]|uniref:Uncharacterized protein n=1 Tax=Phaseolus angularis TaxID=3914 RepID=A0A0L9UY38_PHAAN|nr:hypothetical protein LR48_Vigan07g114300 [Vigna angularis]